MQNTSSYGHMTEDTEKLWKKHHKNGILAQTEATRNTESAPKSTSGGAGSEQEQATTTRNFGKGETERRATNTSKTREGSSVVT